MQFELRSHFSKLVNRGSVAFILTPFKTLTDHKLSDLADSGPYLHKNLILSRICFFVVEIRVIPAIVLLFKN